MKDFPLLFFLSFFARPPIPVDKIKFENGKRNGSMSVWVFIISIWSKRSKSEFGVNHFEHILLTTTNLGHIILRIAVHAGRFVDAKSIGLTVVGISAK